MKALKKIALIDIIIVAAAALILFALIKLTGII